MTSLREEQEALNVLRQLERTRGPNYIWSREEIARVAPHYGGSPRRFNISMYIKLHIARTPALHEPEASTSGSRMNIVDDEFVSLETAVRTVFHAICPHPIRYYTNEGAIDFDKYNVDLGIWLTTVSSIWLTMQDTQHDERCKCCINFRMLATNYTEMFQRSMSKDDFLEKRVAKNSIRRWASGISSGGAKEGLASLVKIGKALLSDAQDNDVSDLSDHSSELSDAQDDETSVLTHISEEEKGEMRFLREIFPDEDQPLPTSRRRKIARRPLDTVSEMKDRDGVLTVAIPEIGKAIQVKIPRTSYTDIGRNEICDLAKIFFKQLIKVKAMMAIHQMRGRSGMLRQIRRWEKEYQNTRLLLKPMLEGTQNVYITRSQKRKRGKMLRDNG